MGWICLCPPKFWQSLCISTFLHPQEKNRSRSPARLLLQTVQIILCFFLSYNLLQCVKIKWFLSSTYCLWSLIFAQTGIVSGLWYLHKLVSFLAFDICTDWSCFWPLGLSRLVLFLAFDICTDWYRSWPLVGYKQKLTTAAHATIPRVTAAPTLNSAAPSWNGKQTWMGEWMCAWDSECVCVGMYVCVSVCV